MYLETFLIHAGFFVITTIIIWRFMVNDATVSDMILIAVH